MKSVWEVCEKCVGDVWKSVWTLLADAARVYEYVVRHFIATLMRNCTYDVTTVT